LPRGFSFSTSRAGVFRACVVYAIVRIFKAEGR